MKKFVALNDRMMKYSDLIMSAVALIDCYGLYCFLVENEAVFCGEDLAPFYTYIFFRSPALFFMFCVFYSVPDCFYRAYLVIFYFCIGSSLLLLWIRL